MPPVVFVLDVWTSRWYIHKLALVSTGIRPGMVTVALRSWQFNCKPTRPSRRGSVCLCADATRVSNLQKSSPKPAVIRASDDKPGPERLIGNISVASRPLLGEKESGPPSFLVSAF